MRLLLLPCVVVLSLPALAHADGPAVTCAADGTRLVVEVVNPTNDPVLVGRLPDGSLVAGGVSCGVTVADVDVVAVNAVSGPAGVDLTGGFGPGVTAEPDGLAELEVEWTGAGTLVVSGSPGEDDVRWVAGGLHLNGDTDLDLTGTPAAVTLLGGDGEDTLDVSGAPAGAVAEVFGGGGNDTVRGHAGTDLLDGGDGNDRIADGQGDDDVRGGAGDDLLLAADAAAVDSPGPVAVPDGGTVSQTVTLPLLRRGAEVQLRLTLAHDDPGHVTVSARPEGASALTLTPYGYTTGSGYLGTVFADDATRTLRDMAPPYTGRTRAWGGTLRSFAPYIRERSVVLEVTDHAANGVSGTLVGWSVSLVGASDPEPNGADTYDGGPGRDTLSYAARTHAVSLDTTAVEGPGGEAGEGDTVRFPTIESYATGEGDDTLVGSPRTEVLAAGYGRDTITGGTGGTDTYDCGSGVGDVLSLSGATTGLAVDLLNGTFAGAGTSGTIAGECDVLYGTEHDDTIQGSGWSDTLWGLGGADVIRSSGGSDTVHAGPGNDVVDEGEGFGFEHDVVSGDEGVDLLTYAGRGDPVSINSTGPPPGRQYVDRDEISGFENYTGGDGSDEIRGDAGTNVIDGGGGNDLLDSGAGDDTVRGGAGNDTIHGGDGDDLLSGGAGNDMFVEGSAGNGDDDLRGGDGVDLADYGRRLLPLVIDLDDLVGDGEPGEHDNVHADVEDLWGGQSPDVFTGHDAVNHLWGWGGEDVLTGGGGKDYLYGGVGNDVLHGQDGLADWLIGDDGVDTGYRDAVDETASTELLLPL
ncbi:MAG TPA: calcium-binding protein [Mycobacteriales bacterium]|jgi:Ca2+-binding RTX toxin-like protein|nr:calcium-binding protein [Mycobacteriales bacterium]